MDADCPGLLSIWLVGRVIQVAMGTSSRGSDRGSFAADELLPEVYRELRQLAARKLSREVPGQTLQATALVHEAYLRITGDLEVRFQNNRHFFSAAAEAMRRILIENARRKQRQRHGGQMRRVDIAGLDVASESDADTLFFVDEAVEKLGAKDAVCAELVKLRFFAGLSNRDAAMILGLSERTAKRNWAYAKAWLKDAIASRSKPS